MEFGASAKSNASHQVPISWDGGNADFFEHASSPSSKRPLESDEMEQRAQEVEFQLLQKKHWLSVLSTTSTHYHDQREDESSRAVCKLNRRVRDALYLMMRRGRKIYVDNASELFDSLHSEISDHLLKKLALTEDNTIAPSISNDGTIDASSSSHLSDARMGDNLLSSEHPMHQFESKTAASLAVDLVITNSEEDDALVISSVPFSPSTSKLLSDLVPTSFQVDECNTAIKTLSHLITGSHPAAPSVPSIPQPSTTHHSVSPPPFTTQTLSNSPGVLLSQTQHADAKSNVLLQFSYLNSLDYLVQQQSSPLPLYSTRRFADSITENLRRRESTNDGRHRITKNILPLFKSECSMNESSGSIRDIRLYPGVTGFVF